MRICPGCRSVYDESVHVCDKDGLPLLDVSPTFASIKEGEVPETPLPGRDQALRPGMMVGEYMIERVIAEGGMGHVYAGIHPLISKRVAIKVLSKRFAQDAKAISRFVLEARSVNQIGHHNIVDIFSIGELDDGRNYLIMELLDGLPMHEVLQNVKRFKAGEILPVYQQLCDALEAAHSKSFVHRDLKPDNVVILRRPPHPFIKILDFGIAKLRGSGSQGENTEVGTVLGTPEYMAPEQCRGGQIDARVDIYALGVMLYELVTGRKPFTDSNPLRILSKQMREQPVPPSRLAPIPKALELVILQAMAKDPAARYATVRDFFSAMQRATPELLPWSASLEPPTHRMPQEQVRTIPPESAMAAPAPPARRAPVARPPRPRRMDVPAPVSLSDSIDTSAEPDDEEETLVADAKPVAPLPMQMTSSPEPAKKKTGPPVADVKPVEPLPLSAARTPPPVFGTPPAHELDEASTIVEDDEPVMLVDRPMEDVVNPRMAQDTSGAHISATYDPPVLSFLKTAEGPHGHGPGLGGGPLHEASTGETTGERELPPPIPPPLPQEQHTLPLTPIVPQNGTGKGPIESMPSFEVVIEAPPSDDDLARGATVPMERLGADLDLSASFEDRSFDRTGPTAPRGDEPVLLSQPKAASLLRPDPTLRPAYGAGSARRGAPTSSSGKTVLIVVLGALVTAATLVGVAYALGYFG